MGEGLLTGTWMTANQPHWKIFSSHGSCLLHNHLDGILLIYPPLAHITVAPLEVNYNYGRTVQEYLGGASEISDEGPMILFTLLFY